MLPTPSRDDAVTFGYKVQTNFDEDFHLADSIHLHAHPPPTPCRWNVYRDEDGHLFFVDRKKDIIRRKGENISATEIEITLMANPKVQEAAVIAVPSELGEDEVLAGIVLKGDQTMTAEEAIEWCQARVARFKVPRYFQFRTDFPRTPTLRVAKYIWKKEESLIHSSSDMESYKKSIRL